MPDGITHFEIGLLAGSAAVLAAAAYADPPAVRAVLLGSAIGLLITPDLDQEGTTFTERVLRHVPLVGFLFQVSWYGYALLFRHRGWSHNIIIGTPSRILWSLFLLLFWTCAAGGLAAFGAGAALPVTVPDWPAVIAEFVPRLAHPGVLLGWWLQDALHVLLDAL